MGDVLWEMSCVGDERGAAEADADADADAGGGMQRRKQESHSDVGKIKM